MVKSVSEKLSQAGTAVADAVKSAGSNIACGAENAVDFVKEKTGMDTVEDEVVGVAGIKEHMDVIASCGKKVGVVDRVQSSAIKLTRKDSPDDEHHFVPLNWVARVDSHVHLNKNSKEAVEGWKSNEASCGCGT